MTRIKNLKSEIVLLVEKIGFMKLLWITAITMITCFLLGTITGLTHVNNIR